MKRLMSIVGILIMVAVLIAACGPAPTPQIIEKEKVVEKPVVQTVIVEKEKVVEKAVVITATPEAKKKPVLLTMSLNADLQTLDFHALYQWEEEIVLTSIFEGLTTYDELMNPKPGLAESWTQPDDQTYIFKLRDAKFHNGRAVTAQDVKFSLERCITKQPKTKWADYLSDIDKIEAIDAKTVKITLKGVSAPFLSNLVYAVIIPQEAAGTLETQPVGTGPYKFVGHKKNEYLLLEKFPDYWRGKLDIPDQIRFIFVSDEQSRLNNLKTGLVDVASVIPFQHAADIKKDPKLRLWEPKGTVAYRYFMFKSSEPPFNDPKVREAMQYVFDREVLSKAVQFGFGDTQAVPAPPNHWAYLPPKEVPSKYDPEMAKKLLAEAGWKDTNNDKILDKDGKPFKIDYLIWSNWPEYVRMGEIAKEYMAAVGIEVNIVAKDMAVILDEVWAKHQFTFSANQANREWDPDGLMVSVFSCKGRNNPMEFCDPAIDELFVQGRRTLDQAKRAEIYKEIQRRVVKDGPIYIIHTTPKFMPSTLRVDNFPITPKGHPLWPFIHVSDQ